MNNISHYLTSVNREVGKMSIMAFARTYFPDYLKKDPCGFHRELCSLLERTSQERSGRVAVAAPRGHAKSTFASGIYVLWCLCYSLESYIVLLSDTRDQAETMLSHVKEELENNELLQRDFPDVCWSEVERKTVWKKDEIITKNRIKVSALGAGQKIRGRRNRQFRPTLIILDDIENDENTRNGETRDKLFEWFSKAVLKAGTTETNVIVVGTIQHEDCLLAKLTKNQPSGWLKKVYRAVISFAKREDLWAKWATIHNGTDFYGDETGPKAGKSFFKDNEQEMMEGAEVLWKEKEDYYCLMSMKEDEGEVSFNSEKQNSPYNAKDAIFNPEKFQYWEDTYKTEEDLISACSGKLEFYAACDPSLGKNNRLGDYSAIVVIAKHIETSKRYVLIADIAKRNQNALIDAILQIARDYQQCLRKFSIESNGFQSFLVDLVRERAEEEGIGVNFEALNSSQDKFGRIQVLQSLVNSGKLQFLRKERMLLDQLKYFPKDKHEDGPDALAMAVKEASAGKRVIFMPLTGGDDFLDEETRREMENIRDKYGRDINHRDYGRPSIFEDFNDD
jgi:predicted phage terminase large subunit-like protein